MACAAAVTSAMYFDQSQNGPGSSCWLRPPQIFEVGDEPRAAANLGIRVFITIRVARVLDADAVRVEQREHAATMASIAT